MSLCRPAQSSEQLLRHLVAKDASDVEEPSNSNTNSDNELQELPMRLQVGEVNVIANRSYKQQISHSKQQATRFTPHTSSNQQATQTADARSLAPRSGVSGERRRWPAGWPAASKAAEQSCCDAAPKDGNHPILCVSKAFESKDDENDGINRRQSNLA